MIGIMLLCIPLWAQPDGDDLRFLLDKEQFEMIRKYEDDFLKLKHAAAREDRQSLLEYAQRTKNLALASDMHYLLARDFASLEDALQWLLLQSADPDSSDIRIRTHILQNSFKNQADSLVFAHYTVPSKDEDILSEIQSLPEYNGIIEASAKSVMDEISTQVSSYDALELIDSFKESYPNSIWHQAAYYYELYHLAQLKDYEALLKCMEDNRFRSAAHAYISSLYILGPSLRRALKDIRSNDELLLYAAQCLRYALNSEKASVLFDEFDTGEWANRVKLQMAKANYYTQIAFRNLYGDEDEILGIFRKPSKLQGRELDLFEHIAFNDNDRGELAELHFWHGRYLGLFAGAKYQKKAIEEYGECLIQGAPRKSYDEQAHKAIAGILEHRKINSDPISYLRDLFDYRGIVFEDSHAMEGKRYTRAALADYDNDGLVDILLDGKYIYRNLGDFNFEAHQDSFLAQNLSSSGGIWADFNRDGALDFVSISHNSEGKGDALMKQNPDASFVKVNAKAGDIDDKMPTEGVAFVDIDGKGYPSLYMANYEIWQNRSGFPDAFYHNDSGFFEDRSISSGFLLPSYTDNPGLAGRGVAPADFDNDGKQEILVTNYRLNRNFLFKQADSLFVDVASLYGVAGSYKDGYYGHSIGADWGDFDNDGDLDLIVANLAHPRFIDISDKSMLYRNDGLGSRVIGADTLYYWIFTDVTAESGIKYDELHAEPLFFDADNDGFLDIYITSVYEHDRSYLYHNNQDGTFTDITYLSGSRVYNGWSCVTADLNRDGLTDLVIGSGNGTKILSNVTAGKNKAIYIKPIYKNGEIALVEIDENTAPHPNSPAYGCRVILSYLDKSGKTQSLIRELSSAKGSSSQNSPELHFGIGQNQVQAYQIWSPQP
jgi:hypothetical protein